MLTQIPVETKLRKKGWMMRMQPIYFHMTLKRFGEQIPTEKWSNLLHHTLSILLVYVRTSSINSLNWTQMNRIRIAWMVLLNIFKNASCHIVSFVAVLLKKTSQHQKQDGQKEQMNRLLSIEKMKKKEKSFLIYCLQIMLLVLVLISKK